MNKIRICCTIWFSGGYLLVGKHVSRTNLLPNLDWQKFPFDEVVLSPSNYLPLRCTIFLYCSPQLLGSSIQRLAVNFFFFFFFFFFAVNSTQFIGVMRVFFEFLFSVGLPASIQEIKESMIFLCVSLKVRNIARDLKLVHSQNSWRFIDIFLLIFMKVFDSFLSFLIF